MFWKTVILNHGNTARLILYLSSIIFDYYGNYILTNVCQSFSGSRSCHSAKGEKLSVCDQGVTYSATNSFLQYKYLFIIELESASAEDGHHKTIFIDHADTQALASVCMSNYLCMKEWDNGWENWTELVGDDAYVVVDGLQMRVLKYNAGAQTWEI